MIKNVPFGSNSVQKLLKSEKNSVKQPKTEKQKNTIQHLTQQRLTLIMPTECTIKTNPNKLTAITRHPRMPVAGTQKNKICKTNPISSWARPGTQHPSQNRRSAYGGNRLVCMYAEQKYAKQTQCRRHAPSG